MVSFYAWEPTSLNVDGRIRHSAAAWLDTGVEEKLEAKVLGVSGVFRSLAR